VTRIGTKRGEASHVRRSDHLFQPQLRCALQFVYCAMRLYSFCFLESCRFANCAICSLVSGFALMVYGYRIIVLRCRWLITPVIRGKIILPYFTIVCWRHGRCWNSFRAACLPIARLPQISSPWVTQRFFAYHPARAVDWTLPAQSRLRTQSAKSRH